MTLPASGALVLAGATSNSINNEFGYGTNLGAYRGYLYTNSAGTTVGAFPAAPNSISFNNFYSTRKIPSGSVTYFGSAASDVIFNFTVPAYNVLGIVTGGAGGGGGGANGFNQCSGVATPGSAGATGRTSSFGTSPNAWYRVATGGSGGNGGSNGANGSPTTSGLPDPAQGGSGYGNGGSGGKSVITVSNPLLGGAGPSIGTVISGIAGGYGSGGAGGPGFVLINSGCYPSTSGVNGNPGDVGYVIINWS